MGVIHSRFHRQQLQRSPDLRIHFRLSPHPEGMESRTHGLLHRPVRTLRRHRSVEYHHRRCIDSISSPYSHRFEHANDTEDRVALHVHGWLRVSHFILMPFPRF